MEVTTSEAFAAESSTAVEPTAAIISSTTIESVEPGASAYKNSAFKVVRPVVPVRSAGIRRVVVISIVTRRRWPHISGTIISGSYAHSNSPPYLRVRTPRDNHAKPDQNRIF
jgi:hypothetical protein